jgi:LPS O-antigen subunit length determinant protein (WzzB/FepE family)
MNKQYNNENKIVSLNIVIKKKEEEEINNKIKKIVAGCNEKLIYEVIKNLKNLCENKEREINNKNKIIEEQNNEIIYLQNLLLEEEIDFDLSDA